MGQGEREREICENQREELRGLFEAESVSHILSKQRSIIRSLLGIKEDLIEALTTFFY